MTHPLHEDFPDQTPEEIFDMATDEYKRLILALLEITDESQIRSNWKIFDEIDLEKDDEEGWYAPRNLELLLVMDDVASSGMSYGHVALYQYKSRKVIIEQNASPLIIYYRA